MNDRDFREIVAEKLAEFTEEIEHCFDSIRIAELQKKINACNVLIGSGKIKKITPTKYGDNILL